MTTLLAIETSCDETAAAVVDDGRFVRSNVIFSQEDLHRQFGGIVPELASRQHLLAIVPAIERALAEAGAGWDDIDAVAVTHGPGLAGSLLVGVNAAKAIALARGLPLVPVNHLEGHIYANWLVKPAHWRSTADGLATAGWATGGSRPAAVGAPAGSAPSLAGAAAAGAPLGPGGAPSAVPRREPRPPQFPLLCLVVSGGHSELVLMEDHGQFRLLGRTRDDAAGEAFDKVARILGLGYPGGPAIQRAADTLRGDRAIPASYQLTRPWLRGSYDFSFSGLKTAMLRLVEGGTSGPVGNPSRLAAVAAKERAYAPDEAPYYVAQMAASFQQAVVDVLVGKTVQAAEDLGVRQIALAGGVAANRLLREQLTAHAQRPVLIPDIDLCTDNAAMIASTGYYRLQAGQIAGPDLDVLPSLRLA